MEEQALTVLAIETSGSVCSVALASETFFGEYTLDGDNLHDKYLAELVLRLIEDAEISPNEIDLIAVSAGPGSFTGLRIGAALAKGLCLDSEAELIPVPTLDVYASMSKEAAEMCDTDILAFIPSKKDLVYYQKFSKDSEKLTNIEIIENDKLDEVGENCIPSSPAEKMMTARDILQCLAEGNYESVNPDSFEPMYIQEFKPNTAKKNLEI